MGNPELKTAATETPASFEERVNTAVREMTFDESKGVHVLPEDLPEDIKVAAVLEKRRRDTQSKYTTTSQALKAAEAERDALRAKLEASAQVTLTPEAQEELDDLKETDPNAWRVRLNALEAEARQKVTTELAETSAEAQAAAELIRRTRVLEEFNLVNNTDITEDVVASEIPPRITGKLERGEVTFEEFLVEVQSYLGKSKTVANTQVTSTPNLGAAGGGSTVAAAAVDSHIIDSYDNELY